MDDSLIFSPSTLHGFHEKKGMLPFTHIAPSMFPARQHVYKGWLTRCKNGHCFEHLSLPFPVCKVYINHHYKFIWIRETKVGGTALREPLGWICWDDFALDGLDVNGTYCSVPLFTNATSNEVERWWKEYFVFSIVRNPYTRFASGEEYIRPKVRDACNETFQFNEVCRDPFMHTRYCLNHECCQTDVEHHLLHIGDQSTCILDTNMNPAVDFLGETEKLDDDTKTIVREINRRRDPKLPPLGEKLFKRNTKKHSSNFSYVEELYKENPYCLKTIGDFFHRDFFLLGYKKITRYLESRNERE